MSKTPTHHPIEWTAIDSTARAEWDYSVPTLVKALEDENACHAAAESLGNLGADAKDAVPALIKALTMTAEVDCGQEEDDAEMDQAEAEEWEAGFHRLVAEALGKIGPDACEAVPALIGLLADEDDDIRRTAAGSLGAIGPGAAQAATDLLRVLDDDCVRCWASIALGEIGARGAIPDLITVLRDESRPGRDGAIWALGRLGAEAKEAVPDLIHALRDDDEQIRATAAEALGRMGAEAEHAVPALIEALDDLASMEVCENSVKALAEIVTAAPQATLSLLLNVVLGDKDRIVQHFAVQALCGIGSLAVEALGEALVDAKYKVRFRSARTLGQMGPVAKAVVPALIRMLSGDTDDIGPSAYALGRIGPAASEAIPILVGFLGHENWRVRAACTDALGGIGVETETVVERLSETLNDEDHRVSELAEESLKKIRVNAATIA